MNVIYKLLKICDLTCLYFTVASREIYSKIVAELPESIDELNAFGEKITDEPEFVEVFTKSPRFVDNLEGLPVFVVTGFRPEKTKHLYKNLMYPTFEARIPENIESVEEVATTLLKVK